jgi:hypothetical protein
MSSDSAIRRAVDAARGFEVGSVGEAGTPLPPACALHENAASLAEGVVVLEQVGLSAPA